MLSSLREKMKLVLKFAFCLFGQDGEKWKILGRHFTEINPEQFLVFGPLCVMGCPDDLCGNDLTSAVEVLAQRQGKGLLGKLEFIFYQQEGNMGLMPKDTRITCVAFFGTKFPDVRGDHVPVLNRIGQTDYWVRGSRELRFSFAGCHIAVS